MCGIALHTDLIYPSYGGGYDALKITGMQHGYGLVL